VYVCEDVVCRGWADFPQPFFVAFCYGRAGGAREGPCLGVGDGFADDQYDVEFRLGSVINQSESKLK
jgi:hypothetical protein